MNTSRSLILVHALAAATLACALPGAPGSAPEEIILELTLRPTLADAALATLAPAPTQAPPQPAATQPPAPTQPPAATQASGPFIPPWPVLQVGSSGPNVYALQYLLRHHGQSIPADGLFGPVTEQAVRNFQSQKGLTVDGMVGSQTWPALVAGVVIQNGSSGDAVRAAQHLLYEKFGYLEVVVDGLFGPVTEAAVRSYQDAYGLTVDGLVGAQQTWPSLISDSP